MTKLGKDYPELGTETWSGFDTYDSGKDTFIATYFMGKLFPLPDEDDDDDDDPELDELVKAS